MAFASAPTTITVMDPLSRKLQLPASALYPTAASLRPGVPSLCLLFLQGRCRQGSHCRQAHADAEIVYELRDAALRRPSCCLSHGHTAPQFLMQQLPQDLTVTIHDTTIPLDRITPTAGLVALYQQNNGSPNLRAAPSSVCRLHAGEVCRYEDGCKFLHICKEIHHEKLADVVMPERPEEKYSHGHNNVTNSSTPVLQTPPTTPISPRLGNDIVSPTNSFSSQESMTFNCTVKAVGQGRYVHNPYGSVVFPYAPVQKARRLNPPMSC